MKPLVNILFLSFAVLLFTSCSKEDKEPPVVEYDITGKWHLTARLPILDSIWHPVAEGDNIRYIFGKDGTYSMHIDGHNSQPDYDATGTYTFEYIAEPDIYSVSGWKLELRSSEGSNTIYKVEALNKNEFRLDGWALWCGTGYTSNRFLKQIEIAN